MSLEKRKLNAFDLTLAIIITFAVLGYGLARAGLAGVNQVIQGTNKIAIDVYLNGLKTEDTNLFKVGETASLTVRNQPVEPPLTITKVQHWPKQVVFLSPDGKKAIAFADPANAIAHDFLVTVSGEAERTKDGFVFRGNKVKLGNQVELEGFKYRVQGVISNVRAVP